ncbi:uncharacterized protein [Aegilops tauschii subsp. strangulata]|uniref:uncharacterized protein isoform X2 n=1 Tax=Triticum aestivum TaxID=4565 RepID=UPI00098AED36|nr:uncharacterized protein LOC123097464 isoform X2 [Triticum aestivum]XP_045083761.1 uncharacterized protein LOC109748131 isoform X2 [Aegilops tauschii subsp. strangulata]
MGQRSRVRHSAAQRPPRRGRLHRCLVHRGWISISTNNKDNDRDQARAVVDTVQCQEVSITMTRHSLGAALNAFDIIENGYSCTAAASYPVMAFTFALHGGGTGFKKRINAATATGLCDLFRTASATLETFSTALMKGWCLWQWQSSVRERGASSGPCYVGRCEHAVQADFKSDNVHSTPRYVGTRAKIQHLHRLGLSHLGECFYG